MNSVIRRLSLSFIYKYTIDIIMRNYFLRDSPSRDCKLYIHNTENMPYLRSDIRMWLPIGLRNNFTRDNACVFLSYDAAKSIDCKSWL